MAKILHKMTKILHKDNKKGEHPAKAGKKESKKQENHSKAREMHNNPSLWVYPSTNQAAMPAILTTTIEFILLQLLLLLWVIVEGFFVSIVVAIWPMQRCCYLTMWSQCAYLRNYEQFWKFYESSMKTQQYPAFKQLSQPFERLLYTFTFAQWVPYEFHWNSIDIQISFTSIHHAPFKQIHRFLPRFQSSVHS